VAGPPDFDDLACVLHLHSVHSDGTGTVAEIARAAAQAGVDVVLLTDHDTLAARQAGEERRYGPVLVCVGEEVSPRGGNHYLAFGLTRPIDHRGLDAQGIVDAVREGGGFGFLSHPFSSGSPLFGGRMKGMPWSDLQADGYTGLELWSFVTDTVEGFVKLREALRFIAAPDRVVEDPPAGNLAAWDRLTATRRVVALGGLDAHQVGLRVGGRVPLRLMSYRRSFARLRTHVLVSPASREDDARRAAVYGALREGRCYLAMDSLADARGFRLWATGPEHVEMGAQSAFAAGTMLHARLPLPAALTLLRDGQTVATRWGAELDFAVECPGVYRIQARLSAHGRRRTWILSNPLYLR
jgi:hypothetical protein